MNNSTNIILKIISIGFFLHFLQLLLLLNSSGFGSFNLLFLVYGGASLITAILLWTFPKVGIAIALIRSIIGIFWAIMLGQFLNLSLIGTPTQLNIWPSAFFLVSIMLLLYIARTEAIYVKSNSNMGSSLGKFPKLILIFLALLVFIGMIYFLLTYLSLFTNLH